MRHAVKGRKLGRTTSHREALFRNQLQSLMDKERIITTLPKAKELRPLAERLITRGKQGTVHARRWALRWLLRRDLVKKLFDDIAPRFSERPGGYLRIVKLGPRQGDGAERAVIEMVDRVEPEKTAAAGKGEKAAAKSAAAGKARRPAAARKGTAGAAAAEAAEGEEAAAKSAKSGARKAAAPKKAAKSKPPEAQEGRAKGKKESHPKGEVKHSTTQRPGGGRKPPTPRKAV
jgi:large subunit ribosomal protein L17